MSLTASSCRLGFLQFASEANCNTKFMGDHPASLWKRQYAGRSLHMFHVNRADGLNLLKKVGEAMRDTKSPVGKKVLYKAMKTVTLNDDTERDGGTGFRWESPRLLMSTLVVPQMES